MWFLDFAHLTLSDVLSFSKRQTLLLLLTTAYIGRSWEALKAKQYIIYFNLRPTLEFIFYAVRTKFY